MAGKDGVELPDGAAVGVIGRDHQVLMGVGLTWHLCSIFWNLLLQSPSTIGPVLRAFSREGEGLGEMALQGRSRRHHDHYPIAYVGLRISVVFYVDLVFQLFLMLRLMSFSWGDSIQICESIWFGLGHQEWLQ